MPVIPVRGKPGKYRIPNVPGTGTKAQKTRQLQAIKASQRRGGKKRR